MAKRGSQSRSPLITSLSRNRKQRKTGKIQVSQSPLPADIFPAAWPYLLKAPGPSPKSATNWGAHILILGVYGGTLIQITIDPSTVLCMINWEETALGWVEGRGRN